MDIDVVTITVDAISTGGGKDGTLAYQLKLGTSLELNQKSDLYLEGVYTTSNDFSILGTNFDPIKVLGERGGVRFRF